MANDKRTEPAVAPDDAESNPTRSVQRALLVLRVMNEREIWTLLDLQKRTELPKSTLHRLLATLQAEHYVYSGPEMHGRYRLTRNVEDLSSGFAETSRFADIATPLLIAATKRYRWPMAAGVIDGVFVRANACTMPYSPYSMKPTCFGQKYELLSTAFGSTYLAFCTSKERRVLLSSLQRTIDKSAMPSLTTLRKLLRTIKAQGYGLRAGVTSGESSAIAVPAYSSSGDLLGVLACSTFSQLLDKSWVDRSHRTLTGVATQIARQYS
ncbi:helix-turn-helix domain-containing protein [Variovorax paradoxus]|uniref:helix-turn-helix domain-containing protein n=1 Tax=Variovorax paradoxus TaxID=34073 RepID=UPI003D65489A